MWVWKQHHTTDAVNCHRKRPDSSRSRRFLFTSRNNTDWKVFVLLQSSQVMETSHDGAEEDRVKRLPEILFCVILGELYLCVTLPAVLSPFLDLPPGDGTCVSSLSAERVWSYKAGKWKWAGCYGRGGSADHSLSDRCLISADSVLREVRGSLHHTHTVPTLMRH